MAGGLECAYFVNVNAVIAGSQIQKLKYFLPGEKNGYMGDG